MRASRRSLTVDAYVASSFVPILAVSLTFFVLLIEMADLFGNIVQYVQNEVPLASIGLSMLYHLPTSVSWALPIATLFSVSYALGTMYANNELIVVFGSGISLPSFMAPLVILALGLSVSYFFFEDRVVIPSTAKKRELSRAMLRSGEPGGFSDVTILARDRRAIWNVKYFDRRNQAMTGVIIVERDDDGSFQSRLNAQSASWTGEAWRFTGVRRFYWKDGSLADQSLSTWEDANLAEPPESFHGGGKPLAEMPLEDAVPHLRFLKRVGLPSAAQEAELLRRFAYALTPLIVTLLSAALVGRFKKNVLLMSLLLSLVSATLYYVTQMITMLLAKNETISPVAGAFAPIAIFALIVAALLRVRRV